MEPKKLRSSHIDSSYYKHDHNGREFHRHYLVYGARLCSSMALPELPRARFDTRDIRFTTSKSKRDSGLTPNTCRLMARRATNLDCDLEAYDCGDGYLLDWKGKCQFYISADGSEIACYSESSTGASWITSTLYGMVLSYVLHLQRVLNLHASAVALPDGAVGFLADPGCGKSTLAAAFASAGYRFVTDDVLALERRSEGYVVHPGFPYVSLSDQSIESVLDGAAEGLLSPVNDDKQRVAVNGDWASFCQGPMPLQGLFILSRDVDAVAIEITRVSPHEAVWSLLENTNCLPVLPHDAVRDHMAALASLSEDVPVWRLSFPSGFEHMPFVLERVLEITRAPGQSSRQT